MRKEFNFSRGKRGPVIPSPGKTRITIMIDDAVIEAFRAKAEAAGRGYQTLMNEVLQVALAGDDQPVTAQVLRKILREELHTSWCELRSTPRRYWRIVGKCGSFLGVAR